MFRSRMAGYSVGATERVFRVRCVSRRVTCRVCHVVGVTALTWGSGAWGYLKSGEDGTHPHRIAERSPGGPNALTREQVHATLIAGRVVH